MITPWPAMHTGAREQEIFCIDHPGYEIIRQQELMIPGKPIFVRKFPQR